MDEILHKKVSPPFEGGVARRRSDGVVDFCQIEDNQPPPPFGVLPAEAGQALRPLNPNESVLGIRTPSAFGHSPLRGEKTFSAVGFSSPPRGDAA